MLLIIENVKKITMAVVINVLSTIDLGNKYNWTINNANIDVVEDLGLTNIKKY